MFDSDGSTTSGVVVKAPSSLTGSWTDEGVVGVWDSLPSACWTFKQTGSSVVSTKIEDDASWGSYDPIVSFSGSESGGNLVGTFRGPNHTGTLNLVEKKVDQFGNESVTGEYVVWRGTFSETYTSDGLYGQCTDNWSWTGSVTFWPAGAKPDGTQISTSNCL